MDQKSSLPENNERFVVVARRLPSHRRIAGIGLVAVLLIFAAFIWRSRNPSNVSDKPNFIQKTPLAATASANKSPWLSPGKPAGVIEGVVANISANSITIDMNNEKMVYVIDKDTQLLTIRQSAAGTANNSATMSVKNFSGNTIHPGDKVQIIIATDSGKLVHAIGVRILE